MSQGVGQGIVGVDLDAQFAFGVEKLDEQGEACAEALEVSPAQQRGTLLLDELRKRQPLVFPFGNGCGAPFEIGNFPTFAYVLGSMA